jgi:hypothetical protein
MELRLKNVDEVPQRLVNPSVVRYVLNPDPLKLKAGNNYVRLLPSLLAFPPPNIELITGKGP